MAADPRKADDNKRRPSSAPRTSEMTNIPKIVLEDKGRDGGPDICVVSTRSQTEMGLPAASMPNLILDRFSENNPEGSDSNLGVFCSPRMTRRSVDLDVSNRDPNKRDLEWMDGGFEQSNSLRVLSSSSRVGSAISLNSEYTARSIGLISNDSSSDSASVSDKFAGISGEKSAHLRRLMSYPEDDRTSPDPGVTRTSQSCVNLKAAQNNSIDKRGDGPEAKVCILPSESTETYSDDLLPSEKSFDEIYDERTNQHIICYKRGPKALKDGRIRQWLQDMDKNDQKEVSD